MTSVHYWIWLESLKGTGKKAKLAALNYFGSPEAVYSASSLDLHHVKGLKDSDISAFDSKDMDQVNIILDHCSQKYIGILTPQDALYPDRLKTLSDLPLALYYKGKLPFFDDEPAIAVVGARKASAYGQLTAKKLAYQITRCGGLVVSGLAEGVDARAHEGALTAGGTTVAVLGNGLDVVYPYSNRFLYKDIETAGALVSEYPPGTEARGAHFPVRNRIISALCVGVLVVEASSASGSLITANYALEQGRDIFAVPGTIDVDGWKGSNRLIKDGAQLVETGWEIIREYEARFPNKISYKSDKTKIENTMDAAVTVAEKETVKKSSNPEPAKKAIDNGAARAYILQEELAALSPDERAIAETLMEKQWHVDDIIDLTQLPASRVLAMLTLLEIRGLIKQLPGKRFRLNDIKE